MKGDRLKRVAASAGRMLMEAGFKHLRQHGAVGVHVERMTVSGCPREGLGTMRAEYQLHAEPGSSARPVIFDLRDATVQVTAVERSGRILAPDEFSGVAGKYLRMDAVPGERWSDGAVTFTLRVRPGVSPPYLIAPDWLPSVLTNVEGPIPAPRIVVEESEDSPRLLGGIGSASGDEPQRRLVQAVCSVGREAGGEVVIGNTTFLEPITRGLSRNQLERIDRLLANMLDFHGQVSGLRPTARLVVCPHSSLKAATSMPYGALLLASTRELGVDDPAGGPSDFALAHRVAGVWWGGSCRLDGRGASELQGALRGALALLWLEGVQEAPKLRTAVSHLERLRGLSRALDSLRGAQGLTRKRATAANALLLFEAFRSDSRSREVLREVTLSCAGNVVPVGTVRESFLRCGIRLHR